MLYQSAWAQLADWATVATFHGPRTRSPALPILLTNNRRMLHREMHTASAWEKMRIHWEAFWEADPSAEAGRWAASNNKVRADFLAMRATQPFAADGDDFGQADADHVLAMLDSRGLQLALYSAVAPPMSQADAAMANAAR